MARPDPGGRGSEEGWVHGPSDSVPGPAGTAGQGNLDNTCGHCRQAILHTSLSDTAGTTFCCQGCLEVHALLEGQSWGRYYDLLAQDGRQAPRAAAGEEYSAFLATLEDSRILAGIGRWELGRHAVSLESRELVCAACGWLVENLLRETRGVLSFEVDFLRGDVFLEYDPSQCSLKDILAGTSRFGYRFRPKAPDAPVRPRPNHALLARLAVSGACFANSMAFAAANYLGAFQGISPDWMRIFGHFGFAVSLPAVAYGAHPFYAGAWRALRTRRFSIDVTITLGILLSFAVSLASVLGGGTGNYADSLSGLVFFLLVGRWGVQRFEAGLALNGRWFDALRRGKVQVWRNGRSHRVDCADVKAGETVEVGPGEYVPFDGVLETGQAWLDTGLLTGESRPLHMRAGDPVFAGSQNLKAPIAILVTGSSGSTRIDRLARELSELAGSRRALPDGMARVAAWFTSAVLLCGAVAFALHAGDGLLPALATAASVFIISCSCALALAGPICRGLGLKRAQALGFHFKSQATLESLADIRCILFDKTGTLTFTHRAVSGWSWMPEWNASPDMQGEALRALAELSRHSLHPVAASLRRGLEGIGGKSPVGAPAPVLAKVREIPHFGLVARVRRVAQEPGGAFREIGLCRYGAWEEQDGPFAGLAWRPPLPGEIPEDWKPDSCLYLDGRPAAFIRFTEEIKPEVADMVRALEARGSAIILLSGDRKDKVEAFAQRCGIAEYHGGLDPEEKRVLADQARKRHGRCLAVGDGFNDSLLFGASDIAMAIQGGAVDLSAGTDILSTGNRPTALPRLLALSRGVHRGIRVCWWISGVYNAGAIAAAMAGLVTPLFAAALMPASSLSLCLAAWLSIPRR